MVKVSKGDVLHGLYVVEVEREQLMKKVRVGIEAKSGLKDEEIRDFFIKIFEAEIGVADKVLDLIKKHRIRLYEKIINEGEDESPVFLDKHVKNTILHYLHRKKNIATSPWIIRNLYFKEKTTASVRVAMEQLCDQGWLEVVGDARTTSLYRLTEAGTKRFNRNKNLLMAEPMGLVFPEKD